ncbi:MAG TPA: hypothetical protein VHD63_04470 [Ktedonobacteraceae bacterium]|nr:hypothetical protein [Ktedonobacteraceae bacterium]
MSDYYWQTILFARLPPGKPGLILRLKEPGVVYFLDNKQSRWRGKTSAPVYHKNRMGS